MYKNNSNQHQTIDKLSLLKDFRTKDEYILFLNEIIKKIYKNKEKYDYYVNRTYPDYKRLAAEAEPLKNLLTCPQFLGFAKTAKFAIPMDNDSRDVIVEDDENLQNIEITEAYYDSKFKNDINGKEGLAFEDCVSTYIIADLKKKLENAISKKTDDKYKHKSKIALLILTNDIILQTPFTNDKETLSNIWRNIINTKGTPFVRIIILGLSGKFCMDSKYPDTPLF